MQNLDRALNTPAGIIFAIAVSLAILILVIGVLCNRVRLAGNGVAIDPVNGGNDDTTHEPSVDNKDSTKDFNVSAVPSPSCRQPCRVAENGFPYATRAFRSSEYFNECHCQTVTATQYSNNADSWVEFEYVDDRGRTIEVEYRVDGAFLEYEETIPNNHYRNVPRAVLDALKRDYPHRRIIEIEKEVHAYGTESYEFDICIPGDGVFIDYEVNYDHLGRKRLNKFEDHNSGNACNPDFGLEIDRL